MNKTIFFLVGTLSFFGAYPALADQCAYISKEQALIAISRLNLGDTIYLFCEPCQENRPQRTVIQSLSVETVDYQDYWQVNINNEGIDLAYVFIPAQVDNHFINLAATTGCPASNVSPVLRR